MDFYFSLTGDDKESSLSLQLLIFIGIRSIIDKRRTSEVMRCEIKVNVVITASVFFQVLAIYAGVVQRWEFEAPGD